MIPASASSSKSSSFANTASSLRWRARLTKEATTTPNDDSNVVLLSTSLSSDSLFSLDQHKQQQQQSSKRQRRNDLYHNRRVQQVVLGVCVVCIVSSIYSLVVTRTWFICISACLSAFHAALLVRLRLQLRHTGNVYQDYTTARKSVQSLRLSNERLYKQVAQLEQQADKMQQCERQLLQLANKDSKNKKSGQPVARDSKKITMTVLSYQSTREQLQTLLATQVQATLLKALALAHHDESRHKEPTTRIQQQGPPKYRLTTRHVDSLVQRLRAIPGVTSIHKEYLQDLLEWTLPLALPNGKANDDKVATATTNTPMSASSTSPVADKHHHSYETQASRRHIDRKVDRECLKLVPILLHQVQTDASLQSTPTTRLAYGTTPRGNHSFFTPYRKDHVVMVNGDDSPQAKQQHGPPAVVFGMSVRDMVAPLPTPEQVGNGNDKARARDNNGAEHPTRMTSPMGSLHSC